MVVGFEPTTRSWGRDGVRAFTWQFDGGPKGRVRIPSSPPYSAPPTVLGLVVGGATYGRPLYIKERSMPYEARTERSRASCLMRMGKRLMTRDKRDVTHDWRSLLGLILGATAIGFAPLLAKFAMLEGVGPTASAFWRFVLALPLLTAPLVAIGARRSPRSSEELSVSPVSRP